MPDLGTTALLYPARPAVLVEGEARGDLADALLELTVEETVEGLYHAEMRLAAWGTEQGEVGFLYQDRALLDFGRTLAVEMGEGARAQQIFEGRITALEGGYPMDRTPEFTVYAEDAAQEMRMTRRSRVFEDMDDAAIFEALARDSGLTPEIDVTGPQHRAVAQVNQSDLAFLRDRARMVDAEIWVKDGALHVQARARRTTDDIPELTYGKGLHTFTVRADLAHQRTEAGVGGWDVGAAEAIDATADGSAITGEAAGGETGPGILSSAFGERKDRLVHLSVSSRDEAQTAADAHMRRISRRFITAEAVAEADPRLRAGRQVRLKGLGPLFDGTYAIVSCRHHFDETSGFSTMFSVERAGLGGGV